MLDLAKKDPAKAAEVGFAFNLLLPDGEKTDAEITVRGGNSPEVKNFARRFYQEQKVKEQQAKRRNKDVEEMTIEEAEDFAVDAAVTRLIGWKGIGEDGKEVAFSKENAARILKKYPFIRDQIMEHSENIFNFSFRD